MKNTTYEEVVQSIMRELDVDYSTACELAEEVLAFKSVDEYEAVLYY